MELINRILKKFIMFECKRKGYESFTITENGVVTAIHFYKGI